ncbi:MAG: HepT-like ribonuclease domain-containing protein [Patescibacteria group bacterium]
MAQDNNKDNKAYLLLMLDAIAKIKSYTNEMSFDDFFSDGKTQSAVIMQLQVIGELAKKVPEESVPMAEVELQRYVKLNK